MTNDKVRSKTHLIRISILQKYCFKYGMTRDTKEKQTLGIKYRVGTHFKTSRNPIMEEKSVYD
jgi:hypothetical protein